MATPQLTSFLRRPGTTRRMVDRTVRQNRTRNNYRRRLAQNETCAGGWDVEREGYL